MDKQIFAALEVADHEIRLIVGEFFNTRFNIIKVERVNCNCFNNNFVDKEATINGIKKAVINASKAIGANINKVILAIPSFNFKRYPLKVRVDVDGVVTIDNIKDAVKKAASTKIDGNLALIQAVCVKYVVNGISSRRVPINERCDELIVDIDLLCADRKLAFDLVACVADAKLEVMDIFLDTYASAKEAALFEQTVEQSVILLKLEYNSTTLALISQGKLVSCEKIKGGLSNMISRFVDKYEIPIDAAANLIKYNARLDLNKYSENPVYIWAKDGITNTISEKDICDIIRPSIDKWLDEFELMCKPILQAGKTTVIITGEGAEMQGLDNLLALRLDEKVKNYSPETLGARRSSLASCLGLFYAYKDQLQITGYNVNSVDMDQFKKTVIYKDGHKSDSEESITSKLRGMLFEARK
ncbi:MAG: cell division protein FtsA [Erysipelotrichaceae bacterium]|jgi:cell division protein FtsA|nr:cell division protein FtsA [Bacillota bacterium]